MAGFKVRHLVEKVGKDGASRFYWQPAAPLRAAGWRIQPLRDEHHALIRDRAAAAAAAERLNAEVDAWRRGEPAPNAPAAAIARRRRAAPGSVDALVADYRRSRFWMALRPKTQRDYGWCLDLISAWAGDMPVRAVTPPAVQAFYESQLRRVEGRGRARKVVETPAKAAAAIRVLRVLLEVGRRLGYVPANAAARPGIGHARRREPVLWSPEQVRHMAATADAMGWRSIGTAILLNEWIGQREGDVLALRPWKVEAEALRIRQSKGGRQVILPVYLVPHLVERLRTEAAREGAVVSTEFLLLHERTGRAWKGFTFTHTFAEVREKAAAGDEKLGVAPMPDCAGLRFMELRHTAVTRLHEAGEDALGIANITGHSANTVKEILARHYLVPTEKGAAGAFRKRLAAEAEDGNG